MAFNYEGRFPVAMGFPLCPLPADDLGGGRYRRHGQQLGYQTKTENKEPEGRKPKN